MPPKISNALRYTATFGNQFSFVDTCTKVVNLMKFPPSGLYNIMFTNFLWMQTWTNEMTVHVREILKSLLSAAFVMPYRYYLQGSLHQQQLQFIIYQPSGTISVLLKDVNPLSSTLFLTVAKMSLPKRSGLSTRVPKRQKIKRVG